MRLKTSTRLMFRRVRRFVVFKILHVDDTPHRIALGVAVGMFVAWTPFYGLHMVLIVAISALLRANKVVGVPLAWLSNPLTVPVNLLCYWIGCRMLGVKSNEAKVAGAIQDAFAPGRGFFTRLVDFFHGLEEVFLPWLAGGIVFGLVTGALTYLLTYKAVAAFRRHRQARSLAAVEQEQEQSSAA
jgi:uncharacterized protein (DUF2062 family)